MSPSSFHEILIALFRERPALVQELLRPSLGDAIPTGGAVVDEASFTQIAPTEYIADLVVLVGRSAQAIQAGRFSSHRLWGRPPSRSSRRRSRRARPLRKVHLGLGSEDTEWIAAVKRRSQIALSGSWSWLS
jgi:hypothetical protein